MKHTKQYQLLSAATTSSAHYKAAQLEATKDTSPSEMLSNAFRDLLYGNFQTYAIQPDFGNCTLKENKANRDSWRALNENKQHILQKDFDLLSAMQSALQETTSIGALSVVTLPETTHNGVTIEEQALMTDHYGNFYFYTAVSDGSEAGYAGAFKKYGLDMRLGLQQLHLELSGHNVQSITTVVVEKEAPHQVRLFKYTTNAPLLKNRAEAALLLVAQYEATGECTLPAPVVVELNGWVI